MNQEPLKSLLPKFIENLKTKGRSPATILAYRADLEQLILYLEKNNKLNASDVASSDLNSFRDYLLAQKYTPKSASRKLNAVKTFFRWLKDENIIANDPSKEVVHPKIEASQPKFLNQLEYRALRDITRVDARIAAIIELILQTGMRISEVANLKLANIKDHEVTIESYATQPQRTIPLNNAAKLALDSYLKERPQSDSPYTFISKNGKVLAVRNIRASIDRYMQKAEIEKFSVNDLRTTFIVENLKRGVDLVTISQTAGHKRLSTTERYLELAGIKEPGKKQKLEEL
ncbi:MAG: tyrosine-type recombinase/integrase [Candidatus Woesebacteria bacterium]|nr:MAG: tyrosine-type recombinase/integrase [Candidatus Woesebacteria bacterium]